MATPVGLCFALVTLCLLLLSGSGGGFEFRSRHMQRRVRPHGGPSFNHLPHPSPEDCQNDLRNPTNVTTMKSGNTSLSERTSAGGVEGSLPKVRRKRGIFAWPPSTLFIAQFSLEIPLYAPDGVGIPLLVEVPFEFDLPNVTETLVQARFRDERISVFDTAEAIFNNFGFDGKSCLLRAICERAESEMVTNGIFGEVINLVLTVSSSNVDSIQLDQYKEAEYVGRMRGECGSKYSKCPFSIFHFFD